MSLVTLPRHAPLAALLATAGFVGGCGADDGCDLDAELLAFTGPVAVDCGHIPPYAPAAAGFACALDALEADQAFVFRFDVNGVDSHLVYAWAGTAAGEVVRFHSDSDPSGGSGASPQIWRFACGGPHRHTVTADDLRSTAYLYSIAEGDDVITCDSGETTLYCE